MERLLYRPAHGQTFAYYTSIVIALASSKQRKYRVFSLCLDSHCVHLQFQREHGIMPHAEVTVMFKIGEFSRLTQVSIRMLRYYDETGLLKPAQIDALTGYRLYSAGQIAQLRRILMLKDMGFAHPEVSAALLATDLEFSQMLTRRRLEIQNDIQTQQERLKKIEQAEQDLMQGRMGIHQSISIKSVPAVQVLSLRRVVADYYAEGMLWKELSAFAAQRRLPVSNETFSIYHDPDYREQEVDIEICAPVSCTGISENGFAFRETEAVPLMASAMVYGPFENIANAYSSFAGWLQEHALYRMGNHSRQMVHRGPWNETDPELYVTEIQIPLEKRIFSTGS